MCQRYRTIVLLASNCCVISASCVRIYSNGNVGIGTTKLFLFFVVFLVDTARNSCLYISVLNRKSEETMRKLGNTLTGIGFLGVCLMTGAEPDPAVTGSFFVHAGIIMIFALTMVTGVATARAS